MMKRMSDFYTFLNIISCTSNLIKKKKLCYDMSNNKDIKTMYSSSPKMHYSFNLSSGVTLLNIYGEREIHKKTDQKRNTNTNKLAIVLRKYSGCNQCYHKI